MSRLGGAACWRRVAVCTAVGAYFLAAYGAFFLHTTSPHHVAFENIFRPPPTLLNSGAVTLSGCSADILAVWPQLAPTQASVQHTCNSKNIFPPDINNAVLPSPLLSPLPFTKPHAPSTTSSRRAAGLANSNFFLPKSKPKPHPPPPAPPFRPPPPPSPSPLALQHTAAGAAAMPLHASRTRPPFVTVLASAPRLVATLRCYAAYARAVAATAAAAAAFQSPPQPQPHPKPQPKTLL